MEANKNIAKIPRDPQAEAEYLAAVGESLKGKILFPEKVENARKFLRKLDTSGRILVK